jgi:hypothetical protein
MTVIVSTQIAPYRILSAAGQHKPPAEFQQR